MKKNIAQFSRFALVGIVNTMIDLGVLNSLFFLFGFSDQGGRYALFKAVSFLAAVSFSYVVNKYFVFSGRYVGNEQRSQTRREGLLFLLVSVMGFFMNISVAFFVFSLLSGERFGVSATIAANIGALLGTLTVLFWNFMGYKFLVFRK